MNFTSSTSYHPQAEDTSIEADIYLFNRLRQLSFKDRLEIFAAHDRGVKKLSLAGVKMRNREAPIETIRLHFARAVLGDKFPEGFQPKGTDEKMWIQDSIALAGELHQIFESVNILYYVSGGVASSIHGEARSTRDLDLVISLEVGRVNIVVQTLETAGFYCLALSVENIKQGRERSLSITHTVTIANADLIIMDNSAFAISQMSRRILALVEGVSPFWVASREDMVLQKLMWGRGSQS
ncbi:hypothetical protein DSM106972_055570 [Dulcicalothrix desertica PCC 7102]|uniref:Uncharacterized protein n=1 Tax=Dulcicalothrix desertica PCC 7102 TaxID=232991 RepID=A0A433VB52_9CYAN|nr:hypothetical protein [Dulcicalothrix desertica]RUT03249.1 hypothetical protein DSM106972_055570 [Dulcicalothrix desertica PCC 7102]